MSERDSSIDGIERRGVLAALATGIGGAGVAQRTLARQVDALDTPGYVVEQGDHCIPITPLSGDETVEAFYDYRTPYTSPSGAAYSSYGTTDLQRPETSICFLYDGPEGLSLVVVHDELNDGTSGGAVTFDLGFENPGRGSWVVGDDDYDAPSNYDTFDRTADGWSVDWTWTDGRSDGGAYRPLGEEFAVTIDPAFNRAAALYGDPYEGEITDWQVLSGDRSDPDRVSLALDEPLVVRTGTCGGTTTTTTRRETTEETTTEQDDRQSEPISADVTVVPGKVNPRSHGRLPVVVRSTDQFDATTLAPGSVAFGPEDGTKRTSPVKRIRTDADGDGRTDLKLLFRTDATGIDRDTDRVQLTGETESGRTVEGSAEVRIVPNGDEDDPEEDEEEKEDEKEESSEREAEEESEGSEQAKKDEDETKEDGNEAEDEEEGGDDNGDEREDEAEEDDGGDDEGERGGGDGRGGGQGKSRGKGNGKGRGKENGRGRGKKKGKENGKGRGGERGGDEDD
ncbi:hypothetical protein [Halorussus aquaticus]|uniref:SipW-cognate class signal peptide n=1 Tax=Halorussus aquaticus TaxID=2953748 RepID=A0ABD5Q0E3_9EURY|nr:hypothetical protein [Halorussus aquaticus]